MKYICFDIGNVICHVRFDSLLKNLSKTLNVTKEEANYFLNRTQKLHDLGLTNLSDELRDHFKIRSEEIITSLLNDWNDCIIPNPTLISFINELIESGNYQIAILSNIGLEHKEFLEKKLENTSLCQNSIKHYSCDVGARKPSLIYYQSFLQQNPEFKGSLYVDDLDINLEAGKKHGFKTFKFDLSKPNFLDDFGALKYQIFGRL